MGEEEEGESLNGERRGGGWRGVGVSWLKQNIRERKKNSVFFGSGTHRVLLKCKIFKKRKRSEFFEVVEHR